MALLRRSTARRRSPATSFVQSVSMKRRRKRPLVQALYVERLETRRVLSLTLEPIGTYATGVFDQSAAEIVTHDPATQRLFVTNVSVDVDDTVEGRGGVDVLDVSDPTNPSLIFTIDTTSFGDHPTSVSVHDGTVAVAVRDDPGPAEQPGTVAFFDADGNLLHWVPVGFGPDKLTFTPDGNKILTANEGTAEVSVDRPGSVSIIDISGGIPGASVTTVDFSAFNGRENDLRADGVRIFPGKSASEDLEPESVSVSPDGSTAFVTLQEANAFAVVDIEAATVDAIMPLGVKDHSKGLPALTTFDFTGLPDLGTTALGDTIKLGGFSGLWFDGTDPGSGNLRFLTVPDRGPTGEGVGDEQPFLLPEYQTRVVSFELAPSSGELTITDQLLLTRSDGVTPITGVSNIPGVDDDPVDAAGNPVPFDAFGADLEGIVRDPNDGSFWMPDEYRPSIYHFGTDGVLIDRFVPLGTNSLGPDIYGTETLPTEYLMRRANRGFEAIAYDTDLDIVFAFIQTPLSNPDRPTGNASSVIRMLGIDPASGAPVAEYVYLLQKPDLGNNVDKVGDAVYAGDGKFLVVERDSSLDSTSQKFLFQIDVTGATNLLSPTAPSLPAGETLEAQSPDDLASLGIVPVNKIKVTNLPSLGYLPADKPEGVTLLDDGRVAVLNDNDFAQEPGTEAIQLGIIDFESGNGIDASDADDAIHIANWPVFGMFMADEVASFEADGQTFYLTANEGDDRGEDERIGALTLDPTAFPNAAALQEPEALGRLGVSTIDGDLDGDGDFDQLFAYGGRSFSIWDAHGNLVFDSGDQFEQITADAFPDHFNADNTENTFDIRSDDKGSEPESVTVGVINGRTYAFVGLERIGGVMVYDVSDPSAPVFEQYVNNRDFSEEPGSGNARDLGVEGLKFISADDSPNGAPQLVTANEVSGTVTIFQISGAVLNDGRLQIFGTNGDDKVNIKLKGKDTLEADADFLTPGKQSFSLADVTSIEITVFGGNDDVNIAKQLTVPTVVDGGDGKDKLEGGGGRDILIGGGGEDDLKSSDGDDILIGGWFVLEGSRSEAIGAIGAEWNRTDLDYADRVANLLAGGGLNGSFVLNASTVFDDGVKDKLFGQKDLDWFLAKAEDDQLDLAVDEILTEISG